MMALVIEKNHLKWEPIKWLDFVLEK